MKTLVDRKKVSGNEYKQNFYWYQAAQRDHDVMFHRDIFYMDQADRLKHVCLHYSKYSRRLAELLLDGQVQQHIHEKYTTQRKVIDKTITDSFIMTLNLLEIFNINYPYGRNTIPEIQQTLMKKLPEFTEHFTNKTRDETIVNFLLKYVSISGYLSKVAEELDHLFMEVHRDAVVEQVIKMMHLHMIVAKIFNVELWIAVPNRWNEIEKKRIV